MLTHVRRLAPAVGLATHLGHGMQRVATDGTIGHIRALPRRIADLDPAYLSRLLGRTVTSVAMLGGDAGTSSRARLALVGDDVPESVFVKMPAETAAIRLMGELGRLAHTEVRFYDELSAGVAGTPQCHGSGFDPLTGRFVLVLEDLAAGPCEFPDTLHPLDKDQAGLVVELLARLHATFWGRLPAWAYSASGDHTSLLTGPLLKLSSRKLAERADIDVACGRFIDEHYRAAARLLDRPPHTVTHGDAHPGNVYFRDGAAGLLDWQALRRGHPGRELAYTLITSMATGDRQAAEHDLLERYRHALAAEGGPDLDADELWQLLDAFGQFEREMFDSGIGRATVGLRGTEKLDAALRFIVSYQQSYSGVRLVDIEPEVVIAQLAHIIPVMRARLQRLLSGPNAAVKAATAIRVAVSHYIVRSDDGDQFLAQLRHAVGIKQPDGS